MPVVDPPGATDGEEHPAATPAIKPTTESIERMVVLVAESGRWSLFEHP